MYKNIKKFGFRIFNILVLVSLNAATIFAQGDQNQQPATTETKPPEIPQISTLPGPPKGDVSEVSGFLRTDFLPRVALTIVSLAIGASVVMIIYGAIQMLTAYGNEEQYTNAKKTVMFSLVGLVISLLSFAIVQVVFFTGYLIETV